MDKWFDWIKKHKILTCCLVVGLFILCLIVIQIFYWIGSKYPIIKTYYQASDVLIFTGSFLAFLGTTFLGIVAWQQNKKANAISHEISRLEEEKHKLEYQPYMMISDWTAKFLTLIDLPISPRINFFDICEEFPCTTEILLGVNLSIINTTNHFQTVEYVEAEVFDNSNTLVYSWTNFDLLVEGQENRKLYLNSGEIGKIVFCAPYEEIYALVGKRVTIKFFLENRISERYTETIDIRFLSVEAVDKQIVDNICIVGISPQNYRVEKYITVQEK